MCTHMRRARRTGRGPAGYAAPARPAPAPRSMQHAAREASRSPLLPTPRWGAQPRGARRLRADRRSRSQPGVRGDLLPRETEPARQRSVPAPARCLSSTAHGRGGWLGYSDKIKSARGVAVRAGSHPAAAPFTSPSAPRPACGTRCRSGEEERERVSGTPLNFAHSTECADDID